MERDAGGIFSRSTPLNHIFDALIILDPDPAQNVCCWNLAEPLGCRWIKEGIQQRSSLLSDFFGKSQACFFPQWHTRLFRAWTIAFHPLWLTMGTQPLRGHHRKAVEGRTHGFPDTQHAGDRRGSWLTHASNRCAVGHGP